jgi:phosphohistidine phosphatase SixA
MYGQRWLGVAAVGFVATCWTSCVAAAELDGEAMLQALKTGGYVIYLRHDLTDTARGDADPVDVNDCSTQRPLSSDGRSHASKIGTAFRSVGILVDRVLSSPFCRTVETAALAFPGIERTAAPSLMYSLALPKDDVDRLAIELKKMLATPPGEGSNTVLVGHTSNLKEATGIWPKKEGGAVIFRPDGNGAFTLAGTVDPVDFESFDN